MAARGVAHFEQITWFNSQGFRETLQEVEFDTPGPVVLQVVDCGLANAHELSQLDLGQAPFVPDGLDAKL